MINVDDVWSRHGGLKQVKVSSVKPTEIGWKYRNDDKEYFAERNIFCITHDFVCNQKGENAMNDKIRKRLDRVTQLDSSKFPMISGLCVINGVERRVAAFEAPKGTKASEFENVLLEQAYTEREHQLMDWMQGAGE